jgi:DHA1 family bicyclomycin/chloramphenicol resistance-like MFS transporter
MAAAQYTLSALLLAFGLSQLIWGPLSDRFGRRLIMLLGLRAYGIAAVGSSLAPSMAWLIGLRVLQGVAMGARVISKGLSGLGVIACLSAPVGSFMAEFFGWRVVLLAPALFAAVALSLIALRFQESLARPDARALQAAHLAGTWLAIVRHPTFLAFSALSAASYGGLFVFLATSSFVFIKVLGLSQLQYGLVMLGMSLSYLAGTFLCRYLLARMGVRRAVAIAGGLSLTGGGLLALLDWAGVHSVWAILLPCLVFMLGHGVHQPCGQSGAIGPFPQAAGTASALNGFLMMLVAFCIGTWLGTHMDGTTHPLSYGVAVWSVVIALVAWTAVQHQGRRVA